MLRTQQTAVFRKEWGENMDFFQTVKQIGIFMICSQAILHFKPSEKYEKYLKLLISVMVLAQILVPIVQFFSAESSDFFYERIESIRAEISQEMEQLEIENTMNEESVLREVEEEIKTRINNIASKHELTVHYVQANSVDFPGKLLIYVQEKQKMQDINIHIDQISTDSELSILDANPQKQLQQEEKIQVLCKEISKELGIPEEEIEVLWYES